MISDYDSKQEQYSLDSDIESGSITLPREDKTRKQIAHLDVNNANSFIDGEDSINSIIDICSRSIFQLNLDNEIFNTNNNKNQKLDKLILKVKIYNAQKDQSLDKILKHSDNKNYILYSMKEYKMPSHFYFINCCTDNENNNTISPLNCINLFDNKEIFFLSDIFTYLYKEFPTCINYFTEFLMKNDKAKINENTTTTMDKYYYYIMRNLSYKIIFKISSNDVFKKIKDTCMTCMEDDKESYQSMKKKLLSFYEEKDKSLPHEYAKIVFSVIDEFINDFDECNLLSLRLFERMRTYYFIKHEENFKRILTILQEDKMVSESEFRTILSLILHSVMKKIPYFIQKNLTFERSSTI